MLPLDLVLFVTANGGASVEEGRWLSALSWQHLFLGPTQVYSLSSAPTTWVDVSQPQELIRKMAANLPSFWFPTSFLGSHFTFSRTTWSGSSQLLQMNPQFSVATLDTSKPWKRWDWYLRLWLTRTNRHTWRKWSLISRWMCSLILAIMSAMLYTKDKKYGAEESVIVPREAQPENLANADLKGSSIVSDQKVEITIEVKWVRGSYILHEKPECYYHELNINPDVLLFCEHLGTQTRYLRHPHHIQTPRSYVKICSFAQKFWSLDSVLRFDFSSWVIKMILVILPLLFPSRRCLFPGLLQSSTLMINTCMCIKGLEIFV